MSFWKDLLSFLASESASLGPDGADIMKILRDREIAERLEEFHNIAIEQTSAGHSAGQGIYLRTECEQCDDLRRQRDEAVTIIEHLVQIPDDIVFLRPIDIVHAAREWLAKNKDRG